MVFSHLYRKKTWSLEISVIADWYHNGYLYPIFSYWRLHLISLSSVAVGIRMHLLVLWKQERLDKPCMLVLSSDWQKLRISQGWQAWCTSTEPKLFRGTTICLKRVPSLHMMANNNNNNVSHLRPMCTALTKVWNSPKGKGVNCPVPPTTRQF